MTRSPLASPVSLAVVLLLAPLPAALAQTETTFTYQGRLDFQGAPYDGAADYRFALWSAPTGGIQLGAPDSALGVPVDGGLFSAALDFGSAPFAAQRWLGVEVRTPAWDGQGTEPPFTTLDPRQPMTRSPYSIQTRGLFVDDAGRVGIGTTSPGAPLTLQGTGTNSEWLLFRSSDGANRWNLNATSGGLNFARTGVADGRLFLAAGGNVGIGTPTPLAALDVRGGDVAVGGAGVQNTFNFSRVLQITGQTSGGAAGSAALILRDPVRNRSWSAGITTGGAYEFFKSGDGSNALRVPVIEILSGGDIAEPFDIAPAPAGASGEAGALEVGVGVGAEPGMVVCIDPDRTGALRVADAPYDRAVAGIVSGAGGVRPGMVLRQAGSPADGEHPVALTGRVYCWTDADAGGAVMPGDLLTTSATPGHALRAGDAARAPGATLGKAMSRLERGRGLVLVLVNLQ